MTQTSDPSKRRWALRTAASVFWLVVFVLAVVTHTWLGAIASAGLTLVTAYSAYRARAIDIKSRS
jgi:hypothetical protein